MALILFEALETSNKVAKFKFRLLNILAWIMEMNGNYEWSCIVMRSNFRNLNYVQIICSY